MPLSTFPSLHAQAINKFSSVIGSPAALSLSSAALIPFSGSFSFKSTTFSLVGSSPVFSSAHLTSSGSGSQGVFPK